MRLKRTIVAPAFVAGVALVSGGWLLQQGVGAQQSVFQFHGPDEAAVRSTALEGWRQASEPSAMVRGRSIEARVPRGTRVVIVGGGPGGLACAIRLGQLLEESPNINGADQRLLSIINTHTRRVNAIIQNILDKQVAGSRAMQDLVAKVNQEVGLLAVAAGVIR